MPSEAAIPLAELAAAPFPTLVVSGGWEDAPAEASASPAGVRAVCDVPGARADAERLVIPRAMHAPQQAGDAFNVPAASVPAPG